MPPPRRKTGWPKPSEGRLRLSPLSGSARSGRWGEAVPEAQVKTAEISEGYKAAIALLRSLRNVSEEEAQEQRETWEMLEQALDEDRYH